MTAWHSYIESVRYAPTLENKEEHQRIIVSKQTKLIYEMMSAIGFKLSETDIQTSAYAADGFVIRDNILVASQVAMTEIAAVLKRQTEMLERNPLQPDLGFAGVPAKQEATEE